MTLGINTNNFQKHWFKTIIKKEIIFQKTFKKHSKIYDLKVTKKYRILLIFFQFRTPLFSKISITFGIHKHNS